MTRKERKDAIKFFEEVAKKEVDNAKYSKLAIEALEQEPVLDKIRAEIEQAFLDDSAMQEHTVEECLRFIDKYTKESEE